MTSDLETAGSGAAVCDMPDKRSTDEKLPPLESVITIREGDSSAPNRWLRWTRLLRGHVESRGIAPVPVEERTDRRGHSLFTLWFTSNCCLLPYYLVTVVVLLQQATLAGYTIITTIVSGQTLSALSEGELSVDVGIVLTAILSLVVSFMGYHVLHAFETYSWIPTVIALIAALGVGGKHLASQADPAPPTARAIVTFGSIVASLSISWAAVVSDFSVYINPSVPRYRIFAYVYAGYCGPSIPLLILGAAMGGAVHSIPSWSEANDAYSVGGVMFAMVAPAGGFGKFVGVLLAFSVVGITAASIYALSISLALVFPFRCIVRLSRFLFAVVVTAIIIPVAIVASTNFYSSLSNFLGVIGYWTAVYIGISLTEHYYFRKGKYDSYDPSIWDVPGQLPLGVAALLAATLSFGLIIPSMDAVWFAGPIAVHTGDIGLEAGIVMAPLLYIPLRSLELRLVGR